MSVEMQIPDKVSFIIETLEQAGFEAFAVGGCVRDTLLHRIPGDWDITTNASPEQVKQVFHRTIDTGIEHGTVTVMLDKEGFEVTTYRIDGEYEDGRHPNSVEFTNDLVEDLKRRDFTINAMAYNKRVGIVDAFSGKEDLKHGIIRCVGKATERFCEDALRILRAIRFSAQLGFEIEEETKKAIEQIAPNLLKVSKERIQVELVKLLVSPHPEKLLIAYETGVTKLIFPEFDHIMNQQQNNLCHCYTVGMHTIEMLKIIKPTKVLRLSALLHDIGKPLVHQVNDDGADVFPDHNKVGSERTKRILRDLRFDNDTIDKVSKLVMYHSHHFKVDKADIRKLLCNIGHELFPDLLELAIADTKAKSNYKKEERLREIEQIKVLYEEIKEANECVCLKQLAVSGKDLMDAGVSQGKQIGVILNEMLAYVLEHPEANEKEFLLMQWDLKK